MILDAEDSLVADFFFIQCKHCVAEQNFTTSRKIPGKGGALIAHGLSFRLTH